MGPTGPTVLPWKKEAPQTDLEEPRNLFSVGMELIRREFAGRTVDRCQVLKDPEGYTKLRITFAPPDGRAFNLRRLSHLKFVCVDGRNISIYRVIPEKTGVAQNVTSPAAPLTPCVVFSVAISPWRDDAWEPSGIIFHTNYGEVVIPGKPHHS